MNPHNLPSDAMETRNMSSTSKKPHHLMQRLKPSLSAIEISVYTAAWILAVCYSCYNMFLASRKNFRRLSVHDLEVGWFGISKWRKDISDNEWYVFSRNIINSIPWLILHFVGCQFIKRTNPKLLPTYILSLGMIYIYKTLGFGGLIYLTIQPIIFYIAIFSGSSGLIYLLTLAFIGTTESNFVHSLHETLLNPNLDYNSYYLATTAFAWFNLRCTSFALDMIKRDVRLGAFDALLHLMAYCFYIPLSLGGPIINFKDFMDGVSSENSPMEKSRIINLSFTLLRYSFWFLVCDLLLHFFYFNALQYDHEVMKKLDLWTLSGVGYSMGQFFHMKYLVFYGLPIAFLQADHIEAPDPPKCIGRIHLYSEMWRSFDHGLYKFIHKYFYKPVISKVGNGIIVRLVASAVTFSFIYIWHGLRAHVFLWSLFNFLGITLEGCARAISENESYKKFERNLLSPRGRRRFHSFLGAPLFLMSILSNFYFFMGQDIGNHFVMRATTSWPLGTPTLLFFMYCGAQTSYEMRNWEIRRTYWKSKAL